MKSLEENLEQRRAAHLYRRREVLQTPQGPEVTLGNERLLAFCSNDYLGLANDARVIEALQQAAARYGVGAGAAHLVSGHSAAHHALEEELADFVGAERALLFSTGYMANLGTVSALASRHGTLFEDRLNHASLIDAARLARAKVARYAHNDVQQLETLIGRAKAPELIITDGIFSMDGDAAPLPALVRLAAAHGARLLVDDAHGIGVMGAHGRGSLEAQGVTLASPVILMGTLGKAFGTFGAFVAGEEALIETLIQQARTYIYTTALPPAVAEATRAALRIVRQESWRRERLQALIAQFRAGAQQLGVPLMESASPIQPVVLGTAERALQVGQALRRRGLLVTAIRPPTVAPGSARLRITFSAAHDATQVERLLDALSLSLLEHA